MVKNIVVVVFLAFLFMPAISFSQKFNKIGDIVFPSENEITGLGLTPLTALELKEIQGQLELPNDSGCLYLVKVKIAEKAFEELLPGFKKYDISGDGIDDLILSNPCASEEMNNHFWVKKDSKYYHSAHIVGTVLKIYKADDSNALSIVTSSDWCCAPYVGSVNLFTPMITDEKIQYKLKKRVKEFVSLTVPEKRMFEKRFIVKNDKYNLRDSPVVNDKYDADISAFEGMAVYGNTLAQFVKGSKGTAIAEKIDDTGRVWWFVIMAEDAKADYNRFYGDDNASKMGWMSSRFLEVIK